MQSPKIDEYEPIVSVVMATYKHEKYIRTAIGSLMMSEIPINVIIVPVESDAPTMEQLEMVKLADLQNRFTIIPVKEPDAIKQFDTGLRAVKTEWVSHCGSDDLILPQKYRQELAMAKQILKIRRRPIVCMSYMTTDESLNPIYEIKWPLLWRLRHPLTKPRIALKPFLWSDFMEGSIIPDISLVQTSTLLHPKVNGYYDPDGKEWSYLSVYAMWLRVMKHLNPFVEFSPQVGYLYRQLESSRHKQRYRTKQDYLDHHKRLKEVASYYFPGGSPK